MADPNAGLINADPAVTGYKPAAAETVNSTATGYKSEDFTVAPNATVASNVKDIIAADSPLLAQANSRAMDVMNARGLLNSSQAVSAGQSALYDAALPIAQADAATYDRAATNTVAAKNQAAQFGAAATNTASGLNAQLGTNTNQVNAAAETRAVADAATAANTTKLQTTLADKNAKLQTELQTIQSNTSLSMADKQAASQKVLQQMQSDSAAELAERSATLQTELQTLKGTQAADIAGIEGQFKQLLQTSASASGTFNEATAQMSTIMRDPNTSSEQKAAAVAGVTSMLQSSLAVTGAIADLDLGGLLTFA